jgi:hypothetical protein
MEGWHGVIGDSDRCCMSVECDGGDCANREGHSDAQGERRKRRRLVSPSRSLRSPASKLLLLAFLVHFADGESGSDVVSVVFLGLLRVKMVVGREQSV